MYICCIKNNGALISMLHNRFFFYSPPHYLPSKFLSQGTGKLIVLFVSYAIVNNKVSEIAP